MDARKDDATVQFSIPINHLPQGFETGEIGDITLPVEVVQVDNEKVTFRRRPSRVQTTQFRQATLNEMEEHIGTVER